MKLYVYAGIVVALLAAGGFILRSSYNYGYNSRDAEVQQDILDAQERARKDEEEKWRETVASAEAQVIVEEKIVERIRVVEKEIPKVVREIVTVRPECSDLGLVYAGMLNHQIRAANRVQSSEASSDVDDGVPGT